MLNKNSSLPLHKLKNMKNIQEFTDEFNTFYNRVYNRWRLNIDPDTKKDIKEKSGKDIVGKEFELFRRKFYQSHLSDTNLSLSPKKDCKKILGSMFDADLALYQNGVINLIEECKGSYVDSCFLKRAIGNFAELISVCQKNGKEVPFFVLSCPTKMGNFSEVFNSYICIFNNSIQSEIINKFKYLPLCKHGRVTKKGYYSSNKICFKLDDSLIEEQLSYVSDFKNLCK
jgi:hypothetical protein